MTQARIPQDLLVFLRERESFLILGHQEPDADCIGSQLALGSFLARQGKTVRLYNHGPFKRPEINRYQPLFEARIDAFAKVSSPVVVILDCSTLERIGDLQHDLAGLPVVMIDHHTAGSEFGDYRWIEPRRPSTTWMIHQLISVWGQQPTAEEAHWLMLGLCTDTGFFRHLEAESHESFEVAAALSQAGASPKAVFGQIQGGKLLVNQKLMGLMLSRTESYFDGQFLYSWEELADRERLGADSRESDMIYQTLQGVSGCELIILLRQDTAGKVTAGLRSKSFVDVGALSQVFGGGGHQRASGFSCSGTVAEVKQRLLLALEPILG